jgi:hypothetical protein
MRTWTPLWSPIVDSSLWSEPDYVIKIFMTILALKDSDDVCRFNAYQLAQRARKSEAEVLDALKILSSPDQHRVEKQPEDGRRIKLVEDGWFVINGAKYRELMRDEMRKARLRRAQANFRAKKNALKNGKPQPGELAYEQTGDDRVITGALP